MKTCVRLLFVVAVLLAVGCSRLGRTAEEMRQTIARADSMNKAYVPMDSLGERLQAAADYYDRHGTANEQVRAHYLLGCVYRDRGEAPEALQHYHDAADRADTTATDCDFSLLARVHGQMAELFFKQSMYEEEYAEDCIAERLSWKAKDTLSALVYMGQHTNYFEKKQQYDSLILVVDNIYKNYVDINKEELANTALEPAIYVYILKKNYKKAKDYIDRYEYHSIFNDTLAKKIPSYAIFYYQKGLYYLRTLQYDSASIFFRKELALADDANNRNLANEGLYLLYRELGDKDSIVKYADLFRGSIEKNLAELSYKNLQTVNALYNYSRHQHIAQVKTEEAALAKAQRQHLAYLLLLLIIISALSFYAIRRRNKDKIKKLTQSYAADMLSYREVRLQLEALKKENGGYIAQQQRLVEELGVLRDSIAHMQDDKLEPENWGVEDRLLDSSIVARLHSKAIKGNVANDEEWHELRKVFQVYLPDFINRLSSYSCLLDLTDTEICLLLKLRFSPGEISTLLNMKPSALGNRRKRLLQKVFKEEGSATDFDARIRGI